jgi:hypothetical protein
MIAESAALANYAVTPIMATVHGAWEIVLVVVAVLLIGLRLLLTVRRTRRRRSGQRP